jgi:hypothetical protein
MRTILVLCLVAGCGGIENSPPFTEPDRVPCEEQASGSTADAVAWRDSSSKTACDGRGIAVFGKDSESTLQIVCCSTLHGDSGWCWTDQMSAADPRECCEPESFTGLCFTLSSR